jgi:hypothetical protein
MPVDNPIVICALHAERFRRMSEETDHDGTQTLVRQYWQATCGCHVEITLTIPDRPDKPN